MILSCDLRIIRAVRLDLPPARWDIAGGINPVPDVGPKLIEGPGAWEQAPDSHDCDRLVRLHGSIGRQEQARPRDAFSSTTKFASSARSESVGDQGQASTRRNFHAQAGNHPGTGTDGE